MEREPRAPHAAGRGRGPDPVAARRRRRRFAAFQVFFAALLAAAALEGWAARIVAEDVTHLTVGIFGVFCIGWGVSVHRAVTAAPALAVRRIAELLVMLGLIGTVIGFVLALGGIDPRTAGDVDAVAPMVAQLVAGMKVALYTTLVGAVFHVWLIVNYQVLSDAP